jgi:hypothetical protein
MSNLMSPGYRQWAVPEAVEFWVEPPRTSETGDRMLLRRDRDTLLWAQTFGDGTRAVCKLYRQRGPVSWWRENRYRFRVQREFDALTHLERQAIPCTHPLFWSFGRSLNHGRHEMLATREIPDVVPLSKYLASRLPGQPVPNLATLYGLVRRMHDGGFYHGSLYLRNVLVAQAGSPNATFHMVDTPKAVVLPRSLVGSRLARVDLLDLTRGVAKYGGPDVAVPLLLCYGMDKNAALDFLVRLRQYHPGRLTRNLQRAESAWREWVAAARHGGDGVS